MLFKRLIARHKKSKIQIREVILFTILLVLFMVSFIFWKDATDGVSIKFVLHMEDTHPLIREHLSVFSNTITSILSHILLVSLVFNFSNILKLVLCNFMFYISIGISSILKLAFLKQMLFIKSTDFLEPLDCRFSWAAPCTYIVYISAIVLSVWWIFTENLNKFLKCLSSILGLLFIFLVSIGVLVQGNYSLSDIIFSNVLGGFLFVFVFILLKVDVNNSHDMKVFMNKNMYLAFNTVFLVAFCFLYFFNSPSELIKTENMQSISYTDCYFSYPNNYDLSLESLLLIAILLTSPIMMFGIYLEKSVLINNDENKWGFFNFNNDQNDFESIYTFSDSMKEAQWNDTNYSKTAVRLLISFIFISISLAGLIITPYNFSNLIVFIGLKYCLPFIVFIFSIFFLQKYIFVKLKLVNDHAFNNFIDSPKSQSSLNSSLVHIEKEEI